MGQGSENVVLQSAPETPSAATESPADKALPVRSFALKVLRFMSVLIGAGLLLRTASAEYVVSAPQQEPDRQPNAQPKARLSLAGAVQAAMPKPSFGGLAADDTAFRDSAPGRLASPVAPAKPKKAARGQSGTRSKLAGEATMVARLQPASTAALSSSSDLASTEGKAAPLAFAEKRMAAAPAGNRTEPSLIRATAASALSAPTLSAPTLSAPTLAAKAEPGLTSQRVQPGSGLLSPVRIVSGAAPVRKADGAAAPNSPGIPPAQISLAPPVMRPGPRKTELVTDVRTAMRRAASAWDYAEALPPELMGRNAVGPRQPALPKAVAKVAPNPAPALAPNSVSNSASPERAVPKSVALAPARAEPGRLAPSAPAGAASSPAAAPLPRDETPRPLAMLDRPAALAPARPAAPRRAQADAGAAPTPEQNTRKERLARSASLRQLADERRFRREREGADAAGLAPIGAGMPDGEPSTVAAEGAVLSLRDRMPRPAF